MKSDLIRSVVVLSNSTSAPRLAGALEASGYLSGMAPTLDAAQDLLELREPRQSVVVLNDIEPATAHDTLRRLRERGARVIATEPNDGLGDAPGVFTRLEPGFSDRELVDAVEAALSASESPSRAAPADAALDLAEVVGTSDVFTRIIDTVRQVCRRTHAGGTPTILLGGETGTGKGFISRLIHYNGARKRKAFVTVNCAALPPSLIEAELFGYERGAFTDAKSVKKGLFEAASGGTLFLDEIGAIPLGLQAKLLTTIEDKLVRRVGGRKSTHVDVHIIAATHEDLAARVKEGSFRSDLFHRLNVVRLRVPALRERGDDALLLAGRFVEEICQDYGLDLRTLSPAAKQWILEYQWPGNVRELRNQLERILTLENDAVIDAGHFRRSSLPSLVAVGRENGSLRVQLPRDGVPLEAVEREILREALQLCEGNVSQTARYLSISRQTLIYRMKKFGLREEARAARG